MKKGKARGERVVPEPIDAGQESIDTVAIDRAVNEIRQTAKAPGLAVAIVRGGISYVQGYGVKERGKNDLVTPDTLFANASTTKAFTAAAVALLVDENKMAWDDPVRKHLPWFRLSDPVADAVVTIRDLLCHRTGLPRHDMLWYRSPYGRDEVLRRIGHATLSAQPRQKYQYQNICFAAAGEAVRTASGAESFEAFVHERILMPLGMTRTNLTFAGIDRDPDHALPHQKRKDRWQTTPILNFDNVGPAGTMNSCARDMLNWLRFQLNLGVLPDGTRLVSEANLRETQAPQMVVPVDDTRARYPHLTQMSYGMGWSVWNYREGQGVVSHSGAIDGYRAHVALIPARQIGVAIFANNDEPTPEFARNAVLDIVLGLSPRDWNEELRADQEKRAKQAKEARDKRKAERKKAIPSPVSPAALVGTYQDAAYGTVTVAKGPKGVLTAQWNDFKSPLRHRTFTTFDTTSEEDGFKDREFRFLLDAAGDVTSLQLFDGTFGRVKKTPENA